MGIAKCLEMRTASYTDRSPAAIFIWFGDSGNLLKNLLSSNDNIQLNIFVGCFLILISIIGFLSCCYLMSINFDSILYARTVNGIRKFFYDKYYKSDEAINSKEDQYRVLPKNTSQPKYIQKHSFGTIVIAFAMINSIYFGAGTRILATIGDVFFSQYLRIPVIFHNYNLIRILAFMLLFFLTHLMYYSYMANYRNFNFMKNQVIGVDIDGVLNNHREVFCNHLKVKFQIELDPDLINKIPVHKMDNSVVTRDMEFDIFNDPKYWNDLELIDVRASKVIQELRNSIGYKINIHSYRPWPQFFFGTVAKSVVEEKWKVKTLKRLTIDWLKSKGITYSKLYIERSSIDYPGAKHQFFGMILGIARKKYLNRFYYTFIKPYRYFIEDTPENAIKLSNNCEYVFLFEQPYNRNTDELPHNVIRVSSWEEIKDFIGQKG
jgi:uncharacterized HAD superfamily protein